MEYQRDYRELVSRGMEMPAAQQALPRSPSGVEVGIRAVSESLAALDRGIGLLRERLSSVSTPRPAKVEGPGTASPTPVRSPMAETLADFERRIVGIIGTVEGIERELDI